VNQVMDGTVVVSDNLAATIDARVAELDRLISAQLSAVHARAGSRSWKAAGPACITWSSTAPPART
jgi:predicted component of type VI protein secretion system